ncbi:hypothetical protein VCV18_012403 [Metarhizium anisopliae]
MKDKNDVIHEFNDLVNMTAAELEKWLKSGDSQAVGWSKEDDGGGESVGHDSGRKIVQILKDNPQKSPDKYTDDQIEHMRKVVSYCKRHLAQESKSNDNKSAEEDTKDDDATEQGSQPSSDDDDGQESKKTEKSDKNGSSDKKEPKKGDTVSWEWGQGQPEGTVKQVKHEKASVTTKKGNTVSRDGTEEDPAVVIDAGSSKAVKLNHELN